MSSRARLTCCFDLYQRHRLVARVSLVWRIEFRLAEAEEKEKEGGCRAANSRHRNNEVTRVSPEARANK